MVLPVFIFFFLFSSFFFVNKQNQSYLRLKTSLLFITLILTLIATFRPDSMADRQNYLDSWNGYGGERFELGFVTIADLIRRISSNEYWFLFVFAFLSVGLKIWAICRISPLIWASLLIYVSNLFILHDMIQMRCAIASGLLLHAVYFLVNRDTKRFLLVFVTAFLFHYSSLIILPLWFLSINRSYKYCYIGLIIVAYILGPVFPIESFIQTIPIEGIQSLWAMYENTIDGDVNIFNAIQLGRIAICVFLLLNIDRISCYNKYAILLVKIYAVSIASLVLFSRVPVIAFRVSELYQIVEIVLIPMILYAFPGKVLLKRMAVFVIGLSFLLMNVFFLEHLK